MCLTKEMAVYIMGLGPGGDVCVCVDFMGGAGVAAAANTFQIPYFLFYLFVFGSDCSCFNHLEMLISTLKSTLVPLI